MYLTKLKGGLLALFVVGMLGLAGGIAYRTQAANPAQDGPKQGAAAGPWTGVVAKVHPDDPMLVLIDFPPRVELEVDDVLHVYRLKPQPKYLGRVKVLDAHDKARVVARAIDKFEPIQPGDFATPRLEAAPQPQDNVKGGANPQARLWVGLSINRPIFHEGGLGELQIMFTVVNDGDQVIDPKIVQTKIVVNGQALADSAHIFGNGPRDGRFTALPPGDHLLFGAGLGRYFQRAGVYRVHWEGDGFRSQEIVFRVLEGKKGGGGVP